MTIAVALVICFVQFMKFVDKHNGNRKEISIIGQESNPDTWLLCKMNLAIVGFLIISVK